MPLDNYQDGILDNADTHRQGAGTSISRNADNTTCQDTSHSTILVKTSQNATQHSDIAQETEQYSSRCNQNAADCAVETAVRDKQQRTWILQLATDNLFLQLVPALCVEGWHASEHLKQQDAHAPPVHIFAVPLAVDHLRSHVLHGPNEAVGALPFSHVELSQTKVSNLDVTLTVQQDIFLQQTLQMCETLKRTYW